MKGIDFIDALSQIDPALADSYLNGTPSAEQETAAASSFGITVQKTSQSSAEHPRRLKLLSAVGVLGSMAACAALVFGFWNISTHDFALTEQSSDVSVISLEADSTDDSEAAATTTADAGQTTAATAVSEKTAAPKTTTIPVQTAADAAKISASEQKKVTSVKNADSGSTSSTPASGSTNQSSAQTTAAGKDDKLTVPNFVGIPLDVILEQYEDQFIIRVDGSEWSSYEIGFVCEQSIPAGTQIAASEVIHVKESCGIKKRETIPDVCGMELKRAKSELWNAGYDPAEMWSNQTDEPYGTVFRMHKLESDTIILYVSNGAGDKMPDLVGKTLEESQSMYYDTVDIVISGYAAANKPDGTILEQSVEPGTAIKRDFDFETAWHDRTRVYVTLAGSGSLLEPVGSMPDMVGDVISVHGEIPEKLKAFAYDTEVSINFVFDTTSDAPDGTVLSQFPAPGEAVWESGEIVLMISKPEREYVSLPDLVGKPLSEAIALVRDADCEPFIGAYVYHPDLPEFTVIETTPGDLSNIRTGSEIRLVISVTNPNMV